MDEEMISAAARAICRSGRFETGEGACAVVCMDQLGDVRKKGCHHADRVHRKLAEAVASAVLAAIGFAPSSEAPTPMIDRAEGERSDALPPANLNTNLPHESKSPDHG